jgi:hypothetical protein
MLGLMFALDAGLPRQSFKFALSSKRDRVQTVKEIDSSRICDRRDTSHDAKMILRTRR